MLRCQFAPSLAHFTDSDNGRWPGTSELYHARRHIAGSVIGPTNWLPFIFSATLILTPNGSSHETVLDDSPALA